ncbi:MAG: isoaspartyl peptidase/L-asparaginase [Firmicutes bacterium]|nr:isoaspartyl peptidase/L-asparaginase [Bacillota bacterium]
MLAIIVHGGMEDTVIPPHLAERRNSGAKRACELGYQTLVRGGSALDAVEAAVRCMEDDPIFDAGTGSYYNLCGEIEMDASIMTSAGEGAGVACIQRVQNPISVARKVMETTPHVLIVGEGAELFARLHGFPEYDPATEMARRLLEEQVAKLPEELREVLKRYQEIRKKHKSYSTVGAVAVDGRGLIAAATSTGGNPQKLPGRVGDTPILGAGTFAASAAGASATGHGEGIIKLGVTRTVVEAVNKGREVDTACQDIVTAGKGAKIPLGVIALDRRGRPSAQHNGAFMPAFYQSEELSEAVYIKG